MIAVRQSALGARSSVRRPAVRGAAAGLMGLPPDMHSYALIPIGYPMGRFGPVRRAPLADVVYGDKWGQPYNA